MIAHGLNETYSEKAVKDFRKNVSNCINGTLIILVIVLLYFLFIPSTRFSKPPRENRSKVKKIK